MPRPRGDLGALAVPKDAGPEMPPAAPSPTSEAPPSGNKAYAHTLSLRLTAEQYRRLRRYVAGVEDRTGRRLTHQAVIEAALAEYLDRQGG
ncbi:hypothetical protein [Siccirubricoccus deserti]|uniref:Uncharacterized protein n=1 Tax=Siccirubricoccus deserti TaxID=2013562 RepID=A0A9X0UK25_9PROT|nr:hypothetical protein [Siccirubricoccus deserti]MBC4018715.1 hypothetical protein [Siccirubricoccus deserti]